MKIKPTITGTPIRIKLTTPRIELSKEHGLVKISRGTKTMSRSLADLNPNFRFLVEDLLAECLREGVTMRPFYTLRLPREQAVLWRQSRSSSQIRRKIRELRNAGADYLAFLIKDVGPQFGRWATNVIPGYSWHQWGKAIDCYWIVNGRVEWSTRKKREKNGYKIYARIADDLGLKSLGPSLSDWVHVQKPHLEVKHIYSLRDVDEEMRRRFADK